MERTRLTRTEGRQQTRARLLEAALAVFSQRGYHGASLDEIAESAGFSKGAVYSNFANKEELFLALLDQHFEREMARLASIKTMTLPTWDAQGVQEATYEQAVESQRAWIILQIEFFVHALRDEAIRPKMVERLRTMRQVMREHLAAGYATLGTEPTLPLAALPIYMISLDIGLALQLLLDPEDVPPNPYFPALKHLLS